MENTKVKTTHQDGVTKVGRKLDRGGEEYRTVIAAENRAQAALTALIESGKFPDNGPQREQAVKEFTSASAHLLSIRG